jgi:dTDP-glucose pyrophosphorylase
VIGLRGVTDGQLCTVLAARAELDPSAALMIFNTDTVVESHLDKTLRDLDENVDGILGVFRARGDHWSFARLDDTGRVVETAEKRRISEWATTGMYYFADTEQFVAEGNAMVRADERTNREFYVAPLYNRLINAGANIRVDVADAVWPLGTPDELEAFRCDHS